MGFRDRIKAKLKGAVGNIDAIARLIHDEAKHPGRPQPHMAARNPLWGGGDPSEKEDSVESAEDEVQTERISHSSSPVGSAEADDDFWFLKQDGEEGDDWSKVNPKPQNDK